MKKETIMKKIFALVLVLSLVFAFAACKGTTEPTTEATTEATPVEGVMSYADFVAAALDTEVKVETYVQAKQGWWTDSSTGKSQASIYTQNEDGAFFIYNLECTEEDYAKLVPGTKIRVTGTKSEWSGEVEIIDATYEIIDGNFIATATDVTDKLGTEDIINYQNQLVAFKGMTVEASTDADGNEAAFLYSYDGSGSHDGNSDLYFKVSKDGQTYTFTVESYLCGNDTDVYKAVEGLKVGDVIDMEGFLYWYNGVNPHITAVAAAAADNAEGAEDAETEAAADDATEADAAAEATEAAEEATEAEAAE